MGIKGKQWPESLDEAGIRIRHGMLSVPARLAKLPTLRFQVPVALDTTQLRSVGSWNIYAQTTLLSTGNSVSGNPAFFLLPTFTGNWAAKERANLLNHVQLFFQHYTTLGVTGLGPPSIAFNQSNSRNMQPEA